MRLYAVAAPGLEAVVAREMQAIPGAANVRAAPGGVDFDGDRAALARANLCSRVATRILVRLGEVRATDFARLERRAAELEWDRVLSRPRVEVIATAHKCRLHHTGAIAERIARAARSVDDGAPLRVVVRGDRDRFTISVDSSGELLHRRGWREEQGEAPLRETLAAGLLALAEWDPTTPLVDPTCGSGTIAIEAACLATRRAPGSRRAFAFEHWIDHDVDAWRAIRAEADARIQPHAPPILGSDRDRAAIELARRNAERAGVAAHARFDRATITSAAIPDGPSGLILCNPPYGVRLGDHAALRPLYAALGALRRRAPGWRLAVLTSSPRLAAAIGKPAAVHALRSGGLAVSLYVFPAVERREIS